MKRFFLLLALSPVGACLILTGAIADICGDGFLQNEEACDDGNNISGDGCDSECREEEPPVCGNGILEAGEQCDDGNAINDDGCESDCTLDTVTTCGDSIIEVPEECDDGNTVPGDGCSEDCRIAPNNCGDGVLDAGEECDDRNNINGDGCEFDCSLICGGVSGALSAKLDQGNCYLGFTQSVAWQDAETNCELLRGHLVVISNQAENDLARSLLPITTGAWIGVNDISVEAGTTATNFINVTQEALSFDRFFAGQPSASNANEDCVHFFAEGDQSGGSSFWNDVGCIQNGFVGGYVCEIEENPCGDNIVQPPEACDGGACNADCTAP